MKRCPECEFLYYDEQDRCDMDGTRLRFTTKLPSLPAEAAQTKSMRGTFMMLLLATIILGIVLFIFYAPHWRTSISSPPAAASPASVPNANTESQIPQPEASQQTSSTPPPKSAAGSRDPFAPMETRTEKSDNSLATAKPKTTILGPGDRNIAATPAINQVTTANPPAPMSQKSTPPSYSISDSSVRPVAAATATPKPVTQNSNKDSKFKSIMKKAGGILKKPF